MLTVEQTKRRNKSTRNSKTPEKQGGKVLGHTTSIKEIENTTVKQTE